MHSIVFDALLFAKKKHEGQTRKDGAPYFIHPVEVATILSRATNDDSCVAAGLLHDVVEDCGVTPDELRSRFGDGVCRLVLAVTNPPIDWKDIPKQAIPLLLLKHRMEYARRISESDFHTQALSAADKFHNAKCILEWLQRDQKHTPKKIWDRYRGKRDGTIWYYRLMGETYLSSDFEAVRAIGGDLVAVAEKMDELF